MTVGLKDVNESTPILSTQYATEPHYRTYVRRWYILFLFSLLSASQCTLWISYSAVSKTTQELYHTTAAQVNFLAATGPLAFIPLCSLTSWIITEYGLRATCIIGAALCAAGAVLRCFATSNSFWMVIAAQFLNAAAGPVVMNGPPALSAAWFGVNERTLATSVGTVANSVGSAAGFFIGLLINSTHDLVLSLYYEAAFAVGLLLVFVIYFPSYPPTPPSTTASVTRGENKDLWASWLQLMRESAQVLKSLDGVLILIIMGVSAGFTSGWSAMLVNILGDHYSQTKIQWLGIFNILGTVVGGVAVGKLHDKYRHFKPIIVILFILSTGVFTAFTFATNSTIVVPFIVIVILVIAVGVTLSGTWPVSFEALIEVTYPVKEEVSAGLLSLANNIGCLAILILGDYFTGNSINWTMTGICAGCFVLMLFVKERYLRTSIDLK